jgi:hypothetical protein
MNRLYRYKNKIYQVLGIVDMRNPASGAWIPAVIYRLNDTHGSCYCESREDFEKKFEPIG